MMIYDDVRRCRRCKRRRMDDEPPEVQQYKTCAKCRIIERTKKKLRKPLAEETMRYGMRQFQEQNQSTDFMGDDMFANDPYAQDSDMTPADSASASPLQSYSALYGLYTNHPEAPAPYPTPYGISGASSALSNSNDHPKNARSLGPQSTSASSAMRSNGNAKYALANPSTGTNAQGSYQNPPPPNPIASNSAQSSSSHPQAYSSSSGQAHSNTSGGVSSRTRSESQNRAQVTTPRLVKDNYKLYLQIQTPDRSLLPPVSKCELCSKAINPKHSLSAIYRLCDDCFADPYTQPRTFKDYNDFLRKLVSDTQYQSFTFISELSAFMVESIFNRRPIATEDQFRKVLMDAFALIFVDPVLALLAPLKFSRVSVNVGEVNNSQPVVLKYSHQLYYIFTLPLEAVYGAISESQETQIKMIFVPETNMMIIKKLTQIIAPTYTSSFLRLLDDQWKKTGLGFDAAAHEVYASLKISIGREQFIRDFSSIVSQIKALRLADRGAANGLRTNIVNYPHLGNGKGLRTQEQIKSEQKNAHHPATSTVSL